MVAVPHSSAILLNLVKSTVSTLESAVTTAPSLRVKVMESTLTVYVVKSPGESVSVTHATP